MPTRWTQTLIPTARQVPAEAVVPSHQLMLRAGLIRKLGAGVYDYLPLGLRSLRKTMAIVREEMDRAGAIEVFLPTLQPIELWEQTGRRADYGDNLFVVNDRHKSAYALGPTHEEVVTELVGAYVESYKQLPVTLYQIQTKFRDEFRPRFGVLRSREFQMKDAYSFHMTLDGPGGLDETYQKQFDAYCRIFARCGLPYEIVEAESGPIGGSASHEFMVPSPTGEDTILKSDTGNYAANVEKCRIGKRQISKNFECLRRILGDWEFSLEWTKQPTGDLAQISTPGVVTIEDLIKFFKDIRKSKLSANCALKTVVYKATVEDATPSQSWWVVAVVRGDHEVNEGKLRSHTNREADRVVCLDFANGDDLLQHGINSGAIGPRAALRLREVQIVVDHDAARDQFWVAGGDEKDTHVQHFNWMRDLLAPLGKETWRVKIDSIRNAADGDPAPESKGSGTLRETKGIEIGHVFKLGDKYTRAMDLTVLDVKNERRHPIMGCYGIGVNRIIAAAIERDSPDQTGHDENGIIWPAAIAPFTVIITTIKYEGQMREVADRLAEQLEQTPGVDVLIDDRDERPGVKFKDADLIGIPVRVTIGDKALADGQVEIKRRTDAPDRAERVAVEQAAARVAQIVQDLLSPGVQHPAVAV